jgi:hypothetical protein
MSVLYKQYLKGEEMTKIRVKTEEQLMKEFGVIAGRSMVPAPKEELQGKVVVATKICPKSGDAFVQGEDKPLDSCVYEIEKRQ